MTGLSHRLCVHNHETNAVFSRTHTQSRKTGHKPAEIILVVEAETR